MFLVSAKAIMAWGAEESMMFGFTLVDRV